jgi:hypothetical protein
LYGGGEEGGSFHPFALFLYFTLATLSIGREKNGKTFEFCFEKKINTREWRMFCFFFDWMTDERESGRGKKNIIVGWLLAFFVSFFWAMILVKKKDGYYP